MTTLFLHIGLMKTGTTAIQNALSETSPAAPWHYLPESHDLLRSPDPPRRWVSRVRRRLETSDVVLSSETFLEGRLLLNEPSDEVARVLQLVRAFAWPDTVIVLTVRNFHRWAESFCEYRQLSDTTHARQTSSEFFGRFLADLECDPLIPFLSELFAELGGKSIRVVPYSANKVVDEFFSLLHLSDGTPVKLLAGDHANVTTPAPVAAIAARLESRSLRQKRWVTKELMTQVAWPEEPVNFSPFTADQQRHLARITSESAQPLQDLRVRFLRSFGDFDDWLEECRDIEIRPGPETHQFEEYSRAAGEALIQHLIRRETGGLVSLLRRERNGLIPWLKVLLVWAPRAVLKRPLRRIVRRLRGF